MGNVKVLLLACGELSWEKVLERFNGGHTRGKVVLNLAE